MTDTPSGSSHSRRWIIAVVVVVVVALAVAVPLIVISGGHSQSYDDGYSEGQTLGGDFITILCGGPGCAHGNDLSSQAQSTCAGSSFSDGTSDWTSGCVAGFLNAAGN